MKRVTPALVAVLLVVSACGADDDGTAAGPSTSPSGAESATSPGSGVDLPECSQVWVEGEQLPADYEGCLEDGVVLEGVVTDCVGKGQLVQHQDQAGATTHFALTGRRIQAHSFDGLDEAFVKCLPQDGV